LVLAVDRRAGTLRRVATRVSMVLLPLLRLEANAHSTTTTSERSC